MIDKQIKSLCEKIVKEHGFLHIETLVRGSKSLPVVEVYMDSPGTLSIDDCAKVSRDIHSLFEDLQILGENFRLDVSSPGTDKPLRYLEQYPKHVSRKFDVTYKLNEEPVSTVLKLTAVNGDILVFEGKNSTVYEIPFSSIQHAQVKISF